jgi:TRAP-type mannitol/chloroaromatic compound transport system substrate-binding protein
MKKGKTLSLILLAALIGALIISGCAAPTPAPSPSPSPAPTSSPTPSPSPSQPAEVITWKMQSSFDPGNPEFVLATRVVAAVNEMSQGRFVIDLLPGGSVVPSAEELDGMRTAAIDATETSYGYHMTAIPAAALFNSRAGGLSAVQYAFWFRTGGGNELASEGLQPFGAMWIDFCIFPPEDWAYTTFPLNTLDDVNPH